MYKMVVKKLNITSFIEAIRKKVSDVFMLLVYKSIYIEVAWLIGYLVPTDS